MILLQSRQHDPEVRESESGTAWIVSRQGDGDQPAAAGDADGGELLGMAGLGSRAAATRKGHEDSPVRKRTEILRSPPRAQDDGRCANRETGLPRRLRCAGVGWGRVVLNGGDGHNGGSGEGGQVGFGDDCVGGWDGLRI